MDGGKKFKAADADGKLSGLGPVSQAGVDFGGLGSTGHGGGDLSAPARVRSGRHAIDAPEPVRGGGVNDDPAGSETSPHALATRSSLRTTDADDAAAGADPAAPAPLIIVRDREPAVRDMAGDVFGGGMMRPAALLAMQVGALTLTTDLHAPWPNQLVAFMIWLAGCFALFLSRH